MNRQAIRSTNIRSVGYDPATMTLEIEFRNGRVYEYLAVPESVYLGLLTASSKGSYFNQYIKNTYRYRQLR